MNYKIGEVLSNDKILADTYRMEIHGFENAKPGQFVNISTGDKSMLLRRPISISEVKKDSIVIIYKVVGKGTEILASKKAGDILDILGPLGNGFPIIKNDKVVLVGGGIGVPPLVEAAKKLKENGCEVNVVIGARTKELVILEDELKKYGTLYVATDDGSYGMKGNVIDCIEQNHIDFTTLYACGPNVMLKFLDRKYYGIKKGYLSFEQRMACGVGICYGCILKPKENKEAFLRVCKDGPVFELGVVNYD